MGDVLGSSSRARASTLTFACALALFWPGVRAQADVATVAGTAPGGSAMILRSVRLKANTAKPGKANGKITIHGFINVNDPYSDFPADIDAGGITALIDGAGMSDELVWTGAECSLQIGQPQHVMIRCVSADKQRKAVFRPGSGVLAPNVYKFRLGGRRLAFPAPLSSSEVTVILDTINLAPTDTIGEVGSCSVKGSQSRVAVCKETGIFVVP